MLYAASDARKTSDYNLVCRGSKNVVVAHSRGDRDRIAAKVAREIAVV
jgi:hypothetical protein